MINDIFDSLKIPKVCKIGKRLFKKQFLENFSLNTNEKKILSSDIESITLEFLLNKDSINILPFQDGDRDYSEIAFMRVEVTKTTTLKQVSNIIQNIPYPLIVLFTNENSICINVSPKRINKADSSKLVVEEQYFTDWIDLSKPTPIQREFLESLAIHKHPFTNFEAFYTSYLDKIVALNASAYSGMLKSTEQTREILAEITTVETDITELKNRIKKEGNFNNKVRFNIELKQSNDKLNNLKNQL